MEDLTWLVNLPPAGREAVGAVDFDLLLSDSPRLPEDSAYMAGWNEAKKISIAAHANPQTAYLMGTDELD